jgi:ribose 5-phosphate isomerase B
MTKKEKKTRIALGSDHAGFLYKEEIKKFLQVEGYETKDFGTFSQESVDYPSYICPAAEAVAEGLCDYGIVLGGSGNGEAIAANKIRGIRCALCWSEETARLAKEHNNANVISIGERQISKDLALRVVATWLKANFEEGRHLRRVEMLDSIE